MHLKSWFPVTLAALITLPALCLSGSAAAQDGYDDEEYRPVVAILNIRLDGVSFDEAVVARLTEYLSSQIAGNKAYMVVPRDQVARALVEQKVKAQDPCYGSCQVSLGGAVGATKVLESRVMLVGNQCSFVADVFDIQTETKERSETVKPIPCTESGVIDGIEQAARRLGRVETIPVVPGVVGGGTVTHGLGIDRGENIVNIQTDETGLIFVDTNPPNANLQINGESVGTAPYQGQLMVGRYVVVAELGTYYHPARQEIQLTTGGATVSLELPPAFGSLTVTSEPAGADVLIDEKPVGKTPYTDNRLLSGQHVVEVRRNMYAPEKRTVTVSDGRVSSEKFVMVEDFGSVAVVSDPPGATVSLDGRDVGKVTPLLMKPVKTGTHVITIDLAGYGRRVETVTVQRGMKTDVNVKLDPKYGTLTVMSRGTQDGKPCRGPVRIDGAEVGTSPWKGQVLAVVSHRVQVDCGGRAKTQDVVVGHNETATVTVDVDNSAAAGQEAKPSSPTALKSPPAPLVNNVQSSSTASKGESKEDKYAAFDARRKRVSFQARLSGGLDLNRATNGVGGLVQIGLGTGRWFDIHTGVGFPAYSWVTDFEVNLWPYGRFIPTLAARVSLGFHPDHNAYGFDFTVGVEAWATSWLAFYVKLGVGYAWNLTHDTSGVYVPGWLGVEFRY